MSANLYALLQGRFPANPDAPFLETPDGQRMSYGELDLGSATGRRLLAQLGIGPGDRVVACVDKSPQAILLYLACLRAGAVHVPLNTAYATAELAYFIDDAEPGLVVCSPEAHATLAPIAARAGVAHVLTLDARGEGSLTDAARSLAPDQDIAHRHENDIAAILYTSGTTGRSKGALLSHGNLASNALTLHGLWGWRKGDVLLHALPIFHVHGLFVALHCALLNGSPLWFLPGFDADTILEFLPRSTVLMGVPTFYTRLLAQPELTRERCRAMRLFISGSAPLLKETFHAFEARTGHRILERYGMTEAGMITSNPLEGERMAGTVGFALPGVRVRVADDTGQHLPPGETGVLEITGPNVFRGYWRLPDKTAAEFRPDGWFITGDMARMDRNGRVTIVGRAKDLIISGGLNVYPKEVELVLDAIPGVTESAVIGLPHPDFGEAVAAVVTLEAGSSLDEDAIRTVLDGRLARFKSPKRVFVVDALPRNAMGKVQKNDLRQRYRTALQ